MDFANRQLRNIGGEVCDGWKSLESLESEDTFARAVLENSDSDALHWLGLRNFWAGEQPVICIGVGSTQERGCVRNRLMAILFRRSASQGCD